MQNSGCVPELEEPRPVALSNRTQDGPTANNHTVRKDTLVPLNNRDNSMTQPCPLCASPRGRAVA
jgi:hypothetical protein